jgi:SulP family sulfate permease
MEAGNLKNGLAGGIGGCVMLDQSIINVKSGGDDSQWPRISKAIFPGCGIVATAPLLDAVPVASLAVVMLLICRSKISWSSSRMPNKVPKLDALVIALVSITIVQKGLAQAVLLEEEQALLALLKAIYQPDCILVRRRRSKALPTGGSLFFGSNGQFSSLFAPKSDPDEVIYFTDSRVMDRSALNVIHTLADQYGSLGKKVYLRHLSRDCGQQLANVYKTGELPPCEIVEGDPQTDPVYGVAEESNLYTDVGLN